MGYESDTLFSYNYLRNRSYSIMLIFTDYMYTTQIHLPRPDPTISSSRSFPASALPWYRIHKWGGMPPVLIWSPAVSKFTPVWGVILWLLAIPPLGGYSYYSSGTCFAIIPVICLDAQCWKPSRTFNIAPITTQLSLLYIITDCATDLYINPRARTVSVVFINTLEIISHCLFTLFRFWNTVIKFLLL